jgi:hypothetical protein
MQEQFISHKLALRLKELGFNHECIATIDQTEYVHIKGKKYPVRGAMCYIQVDVPLWQQVFDWFREKHELRSFIDSSPEDENSMRYFYTIKFDKGYGREPFFSGWFDSYSKTREACLKKLIELIENNLK